MMTTPTDKTAASVEGSSIWCFSMRPWPEQIDELVTAGQYSDALALLETVDDTLLPDKVRATFARNFVSTESLYRIKEEHKSEH